MPICAESTFSGVLAWVWRMQEILSFTRWPMSLQRFIPAGAGNTSLLTQQFFFGSSLRAQGRRERFIPAGAGNTEIQLRRFIPAGAGNTLQTQQSSLRAQGRLLPYRFIPAGAGNTHRFGNLFEGYEGGSSLRAQGTLMLR